MPLPGERKKRKKNKAKEGSEGINKHKKTHKKKSKKSRRRSRSEDKDGSQEHIPRRVASDSSCKSQDGESSSKTKGSKNSSRRKYKGDKSSSHTKHTRPSSSLSSTGERSKSPQRGRRSSPASSSSWNIDMPQHNPGTNTPREASNGRYSRRDRGNSLSREGSRNLKRERSPSTSGSSTRPSKDRRWSSRGRPQHRKDTAGTPARVSADKIGLHDPRLDSSPCHRSSRGSTYRSKERSRSPEHRRWSPSPSPTAPSRQRRSNSFQGESASPADQKWNRKVTNDGSSRRIEVPAQQRESRHSSLPSSADQRLNRIKEIDRNKAATRPKANTSNGKESENGNRSEEAVDTRRRLKETPRASDESRRQAPRTSAKKKSRGKSSLLSFGDDIGEEEEGSSEFQGLGAATLNEFKRNQRSQTSMILAPAVADAPEETPTAAGFFGDLVEKNKDARLGPPKISMAECRGQREYQEDRHVVVSCLHSSDDAHTKFEANPPCFFAVYDGHNGDLASEIAKSKLHTFVAKAAPSTGLLGKPPELLEGLLRAAFASTESDILEKAETDGSRQDGTTVTACLLAGDLLVTANVGDSRAVLGSVGQGNTLHCRDISTDHKPEIALEKRRIEAAGGEVVFNGCFRIQHGDVACRLAVSRSLGDRQFKDHRGGEHVEGEAAPKRKEQLVSPEPAVKSVRLASRDRVVIVASDGLWDVMTGLEAVEIAIAAYERAPGNAKKAPSWVNALTNGVAGNTAEADPANALMKEAVKRETADNVTVVVVVLPWD